MMRVVRRLSFVAAIALAGCGGAAAPAASSAPASAPGNAASAAAKASGAASAKPAVQASASAAGQKDTVRSAFLTFTSAASMPWVAKGAGIYDKYGLDVSLTYIAPATLNQTLLAGKDLDVGYGSAANLVTLDAQGGDLVILAASIQGGLFTIVGGKGIKTIQDLRGKTAAMTTVGSTTDLVLRQVLQDNGLTPNKDANVIATGPDPPTMVAALQSGQIAAGIFSEPFASILQAQGGTVLYDQAASGVKAVQIPITVKRTYVAGHRDLLKRVLMANMEAIHLMKKNPAEAVKYTVPFIKIEDTAVLQHGLEAIMKITDDDLSVPMDDLAQSIKIAAGTIPEVAKLKPEDLVDLSLLQEIKASGFLDKLKQS
jgi:NitT/TauT family transport system substrate-binding protein